MTENTSKNESFAKQTQLLNPATIRAQDMQLAMNLAKTRERFRWELSYLSLMTVGTGLRWAASLKFPTPMMIPLSALAMVCAWEWDSGYGNKLSRVHGEAIQIMQNESYKWFQKT